MTLDQARAAAREYMSRVGQGDDPAREKEKRKDAVTVAELAAAYMDRPEKPMKDRTRQDYERRVRARFVPVFGEMPAWEISRLDVRAAYDDWLHGRKLGESKGRAIKATLSPVEAKRNAVILKAMLTWAATSAAYESQFPANWQNPVAGLAYHKELKRDRKASQEELARLGAVLTEGVERWEHGKQPSETAPLVPTSVADQIMLLLLTGCRRSEISNLTWEEVDLPGATLRLKDSKTGAKDVVLNGPARDVLARQERLETSPFVFPSTKDPSKPFAVWTKVWDRIRKAAELEDFRIHDLRHSFASVGASSGMGLPVVGALLGHTQASTTQRYAHLYDDPLRKASDVIGVELANAIAGKAVSEKIEEAPKLRSI